MHFVDVLLRTFIVISIIITDTRINQNEAEHQEKSDPVVCTVIYTECVEGTRQ